MHPHTGGVHTVHTVHTVHSTHSLFTNTCGEQHPAKWTHAGRAPTHTYITYGMRPHRAHHTLTCWCVGGSSPTTSTLAVALPGLRASALSWRTSGGKVAENSRVWRPSRGGKRSRIWVSSRLAQRERERMSQGLRQLTTHTQVSRTLGQDGVSSSLLAHTTPPRLQQSAVGRMLTPAGPSLHPEAPPPPEH